MWSHELTGGTAAVSVRPFGRLSAAQRRGVMEEVDRLGRFLDAPARVSWETP